MKNEPTTGFSNGKVGDSRGGVSNPERDKLDQKQGVMSTEQELDMVHKNIGGGDPSADGNFPSAKELKLLNSGEITPKDFDAKWG